MPTDPNVNPFPGDPDYTDPASTSTNYSTREADSTYIHDFIDGHIPIATANGMFVVTNTDERRGPYADAANPNHGFYYSPLHLNSEHCGTCHDVSNPAYTNDGDNTYSLNALGEPASNFSPYAM